MKVFKDWMGEELHRRAVMMTDSSTFPDWYDNPNPCFGGKSPAEIIASENESEILRLYEYMKSADR